MNSVARARLRLVAIYGGCFALLFWALAPIYWLIVSSISNRADLYAAPNKVWIPAPPRARGDRAIRP